MAIKRSSTPTEVIPLGHLGLHQEDLEKIAEIVFNEYGNLNIDFHDEAGHTGNHPKDIPEAQGEAPEHLSILTLTGENNKKKISVNLGPDRSYVTIENPDSASRGAGLAIANFCNERRLKFGFLRRKEDWTRIRFRYNVATTTTLLPGILFLALSSSLEPANQAIGDGLQGIGVPLTIVGLVNMIYGFFHAGILRGTLIINAPKSTRPSHWSKYKATYISSLASAFAGGVIGYGVNQLPPWPWI